MIFELSNIFLLKELRVRDLVKDAKRLLGISGAKDFGSGRVLSGDYLEKLINTGKHVNAVFEEI